MLKWLHDCVFEKVMLWQSVAVSHDLWHASRLGNLPGDWFSLTSPAFGSHAASLPTNSHVRFESVEVMYVSETKSVAATCG